MRVVSEVFIVKRSFRIGMFKQNPTGRFRIRPYFHVLKFDTRIGNGILSVLKIYRRPDSHALPAERFVAVTGTRPRVIFPVVGIGAGRYGFVIRAVYGMFRRVCRVVLSDFFIA